MLTAFHRAAVVALATALLLVPAVARAHQRVEHRDATRLSIRHSWIGVAPPTKPVVTPRQIVAVPAVTTTEPEPHRLSPHAVLATDPALHPILDVAPDPLRGPPVSLA